MMTTNLVSFVLSLVLLTLPNVLSAIKIETVHTKSEVLHTRVINSAVVYLFEVSIRGIPEDLQLETSVGPEATHKTAFVLRRGNFVESWNLPLDKDKYYRFYNKTICERDIREGTHLRRDHQNSNADDNLSVSVSTLSTSNVSFTIYVRRINIKIGLNDVAVATLTPLSPAVYRFEYGSHTYNSSSIRLAITSDDSYCLIASVQPLVCPVLDSYVTIKNRGRWYTMTKHGTIMIHQIHFPRGFYILLFFNGDDSECYKNGTFDAKSVNRTKTVSIHLSESIDDFDFFYWTYGTMVVLIGISVFSWMLSGGIVSILNYMTFRETLTDVIQLETTDDAILLVSSLRLIYQYLQYLKRKILEGIGSLKPARIVYLNEIFDDENTSERHSRFYLSVIVPIGFYYIFPAINLVNTYLNESFDTGNMDLCYYNFDCAFPFYTFYDFNHVYSNLGYIILGVAALTSIQIYQSVNPKQENKGVPQQSGLAYALGVSIIFEGVLSACYHVCPNQSNFRHDTCFMYISVVLMILKLYQARHPNLKCSPVTTIFILSLIQLFDFLGQYLQHWWYLLIFDTVYVLSITFLSVKLYILGTRPITSKKTWKALQNHFLQNNRTETELNLRVIVASKDVYWLAVAGTVLNTVLIGYNVWQFIITDKTFDFGSYILSILIGNMTLYMFYYIIMKIIHGERVEAFPALAGTVSAVLWVIGVMNFTDVQSSWEETPALSRLYNKPCKMTFYDAHDLWHLYSAGSLYSSLLMVHSLDQDVIYKPRDKIPVF